jgi:hypothetical protein
MSECKLLPIWVKVNSIARPRRMACNWFLRNCYRSLECLITKKYTPLSSLLMDVSKVANLGAILRFLLIWRKRGGVCHINVQSDCESCLAKALLPVQKRSERYSIYRFDSVLGADQAMEGASSNGTK